MNLKYPNCGWKTCYWRYNGECIRPKGESCPEIIFRTEERRKHDKGR
jgi:hypothetical protein